MQSQSHSNSATLRSSADKEEFEKLLRDELVELPSPSRKSEKVRSQSASGTASRTGGMMKGLTPQVESFLQREMGVAAAALEGRSAKERAVLNFYDKVAASKAEERENDKQRQCELEKTKSSKQSSTSSSLHR